jgi:hypothetical protein
MAADITIAPLLPPKGGAPQIPFKPICSVMDRFDAPAIATDMDTMTAYCGERVGSEIVRRNGSKELTAQRNGAR